MPTARRPSHNRLEPHSEVTGIYQMLAKEHPPALYQLCFAVLCERWAGFTLISTAALMLCERSGFPKADALRLWGCVSAASYLGSLPGGHIVDRCRSPCRVLSSSMLILLLGYLALSLPCRPAVLVAFGTIIIGQSFYKPSIQRTLASLYPTGDPRLEGAQVLLHIAINLGAAAGSFAAGILVRFAGWSVTYASAALLLGVGLAFLWRQERDPDPHSLTLLARHSTSNNSQLATGFRSFLTIGTLTIAMFLFTVATAQAEGALLLWAESRTDRLVLGFEIPVAWFVTFAALLVLLLAPIQLAVLPMLKDRLGTGKLVALGLLAAAASFAVLIPTTLWTSRISIAWPAASLSFFVVAELLVAPLGLALLLRSTPNRYIGVITGLWYSAGALGYYVGGEIGALWSLWPTQRILLLMSLLPLCGAVLLWRARTTPGS